MNIRRTFPLLTTAIYLLIVAGTAHAINVSTVCNQPDCMEYNRFLCARVRPGDVIQHVATIRSSETVTKHILFYHASPVNSSDCGFALAQYSEPKTGLASWMEISEYNGFIGPKASIDIPFTIRVPENASPGGYAAGFLVQEVKDGECDGGICLLLRNGVRIYLGIMGAAHYLKVPDYPAVELADIDADGDVDRLEGKTLYRNEAGIFVKQAEPYAGLTSGQPRFADLNGDGILDMFTVNWPTKIRMYVNTGTPAAPVWGVANDAIVDIGSDYVSDMTFEDVDADGDLDIFIATTRGYIVFWRNDGSASAPAFTLVSSRYLSEYTDFSSYVCPKRVVFVDVDGDGVKEMILGEANRPYVFGRVGGGAEIRWSLRPGLLDFLGVDVDISPAVADVDGDGRTDLYAACVIGLYTYEFPMGDMDGDGKMGLGDVMLALRTAAGVLSVSSHPESEVTGDQRIGLEDALRMMRMLAE